MCLLPGVGRVQGGVRVGLVQVVAGDKGLKQHLPIFLQGGNLSKRVLLKKPFWFGLQVYVHDVMSTGNGEVARKLRVKVLQISYLLTFHIALLQVHFIIYYRLKLN